MKRREIAIPTPSGAKIIVRKSRNGKTVDAIRFERSDRITKIVNDGKQWHEFEGRTIWSYGATAKYAWALEEMACRVEEAIEKNWSDFR